MVHLLGARRRGIQHQRPRRPRVLDCLLETPRVGAFLCTNASPTALSRHPPPLRPTFPSGVLRRGASAGTQAPPRCRPPGSRVAPRPAPRLPCSRGATISVGARGIDPARAP